MSFHRVVGTLLFPVTFVLSLVAGGIGLSRGYAVPAVLGVVNVLVVCVVASAERLIPFAPEWNRSRGDVGTDLLHGIVSNLLAPQLYQWIAIITLAPIAQWLAHFAGFSLWPHHWPLGAQVALSLVVAEFGQYWVHRWAHTKDFLWRLHSTHHSPARLYWLNAGRDHPFGVLILFGAESVLLLLLGINERALAMQILATAVIGLFQHANIEMRVGWLNRFFSLGEVHRWHHSKVIAEANNNYGSNLSVWDVVFGTYFLPNRAPPLDIGIGGLPAFPTTYLAQLMVPFRWRHIHAASQSRMTADDRSLDGDFLAQSDSAAA